MSLFSYATPWAPSAELSLPLVSSSPNLGLLDFSIPHRSMDLNSRIIYISMQWVVF